MTFPVSITVDATSTLGELTPIWRFFGYDEPNYTYMRDGKKLLSELGQLGAPQVYVRCHSLLVTGEGTHALKWGSTNAYTEDENGNPIYDWTIVDKIFDTYLERGLKPYVQIGFMPEAMSSHPLPYRHYWTPEAKYNEIYTGWAYPPKDYDQWAELVYQWTKHCIEKYGHDEANSWYWQVWNEANIGYWQGTQAEFFKLYDYTVDAVRRALPTARVGGPEIAGGSGGDYLQQFLEHCRQGTNFVTGEQGSPLDFISFHAKGDPKFADGHVRMGMSNQLNDIDAAFGVIASFPEFKDLPIVIGESDPEGCGACQGPQMGYRNGTMYSSYTAASFARKHDLAAKHGVNFEGALTWAFEFEDQPYFAGFRALATNGIDCPVLNVFRMFGKMSGQRLSVTSSSGIDVDTIRALGVRGEPDISALASRDGNTVSLLLWHYHDDDVLGPDAEVAISLAGLPSEQSSATVTQYWIDAEHSNAYEVWKKMGSPQNPTSEQYAELEQVGQLAMMGTSETISIEDGRTTLNVTLPRQAVAFFVMECHYSQGVALG